MSKVLLMANHSMSIYNFRLELIERLLKDGHQVIISAPYAEQIDKLVEMGCEFRDISIERRGTNPLKDLKLLKNYKKLLKEVKPDIVFTYTIPCVVNITGLGSAVENPGLLQMITVFLYKMALKKAKKVFFQNEENMQFMLKKKIVKSNYGLLPGSGVNLERFSPIEYPSEDKISFVFISRIMKEKGIEQYFDAAEYIKSKYPNTEFHICGFCEEEYEQRLKDLNDKGTVIYHGLVSDVREVIKDCHCTVHPSYYPEGMSNVLLESSACARPVITTDRSGCREIVEDGVNGFVTNQRDSADLIEKIEKFIALTYEQKRQMGLNGRAKVEKEFDRQIVVNKYLEEVNGL